MPNNVISQYNKLELRGSVSRICLGACDKNTTILSIHESCGLRFEPCTSTPTYAVVPHVPAPILTLQKSILNPNSRTPKPDRPQHDGDDSRVIAQQYASSTLVSLRFHLLQEKIRRA
jgi:hypothetical protein